MPRIAFRRLCREIIQDIDAEYNERFPEARTDVVTGTMMATDALQEAAEAYLHEFFTGKNPHGYDLIEEFVILTRSNQQESTSLQPSAELCKVAKQFCRGM